MNIFLFFFCSILHLFNTDLKVIYPPIFPLSTEKSVRLHMWHISWLTMHQSDVVKTYIHIFSTEPYINLNRDIIECMKTNVFCLLRKSKTRLEWLCAGTKQLYSKLRTDTAISLQGLKPRGPTTWKGPWDSGPRRGLNCWAWELWLEWTLHKKKKCIRKNFLKKKNEKVKVELPPASTG